jgi:hypothetical protein
VQGCITTLKRFAAITPLVTWPVINNYLDCHAATAACFCKADFADGAGSHKSHKWQTKMLFAAFRYALRIHPATGIVNP